MRHNFGRSTDLTFEERFWLRVKKAGPADCWLWTGNRNAKGYGKFDPARGTTLYAHRVSYELHYGPIPARHVVCHQCDNPPCVNPAHLFLGRPSDNINDMVGKRRNRPPRKLTTEQVTEIKRQLKAGVSQGALAKRYDVCQHTIWSIASGKTWKWVDVG